MVKHTRMASHSSSTLVLIFLLLHYAMKMLPYPWLVLQRLRHPVIMLFRNSGNLLSYHEQLYFLLTCGLLVYTESKPLFVLSFYLPCYRNGRRRGEYPVLCNCWVQWSSEDVELIVSSLKLVYARFACKQFPVSCVK